MATAEVLVDTDVLIDHLRGSCRLRADENLGVSVVTRCELFAGRDDPDGLRRFLSAFISLPIDPQLPSSRAGPAGRLASPPRMR